MKFLSMILVLIMLAGCAQLTLEPADFAWPIETVLDVDDDGFIHESRYSISTNVKPIFTTEMNDSTSYLKSSVRLIRDIKGYYYIAANGFKNVYLFNAVDGKLVLHNKFLISEFGLDLPAFNQRKPYIELLDGEEHVVFLSPDGIKGEE
jgi:hypothetical protein